MAKTIVGVFSDANAANDAVRALTAAGVPRDHVGITSNETASKQSEPGFGDRVLKFFESLFVDDGDRHHASAYTDAWKRGKFLVVADVAPELVDTTVTILNRHGTVDLSRSEQQTSAIPVVQEELAVGKHVVQRGGVRIHSYVEERPIEEVVRLREELLTVDRRPVSRPAERSDATFQERTVDVIAQGEEAVAEKRARVVEEVVVAKDVAEREETVRDTVRRKDVDVEHLDATKAKSAATRPAVPQDAPQR